MPSPLGSKQNIKVFVLYLMQNVGYPMDFVTLNDIVMQTDYVAYLDFAESFSAMVDTDLVACVGTTAQGESTYAVTDKGAMVVDTLKGDILPSILEESLTLALRHLDFSRRGVKASVRTTENPTGGYDFVCTLTEGKKTLLSVTLWVDSAERAARMEEQFRRSPEHTYRAALALLSGNVDYLFG